VPDVAGKGVKSVNVELSFEDAIRLSVAIQEAILCLNRYDRSLKDGKNMGLVLSVKTKNMTIAVIESAVGRTVRKASEI